MTHKMTIPEQQEIRERWANRPTYETLAAEYGVSKSAIRYTLHYAKLKRGGVPRKFSDEQVRLIREERRSGLTLKALARRHGCTHVTILRIVNGLSYQDVA